MYRPLIPVVILITILSQKAVSQRVKLVSYRTAIEYYQAKPATALTATRNVEVKIEYWADKTGAIPDQTVELEIASQDAATSKPQIFMVAPKIAGNDFRSKPDTLKVMVPVTLERATSFTPETFTIGIKKLDASKGGSVEVNIQKDPIVAAVDSTPKGLMLLNAVNFDFDGSGGSSYVGHLNIFSPDVIQNKKWPKVGLNLGIMKINFSRNDSLNKSYDYRENALLRPLDTIRVGTKYLRQYNKLTTVSKNITYSFYFQPTIGLIYKSNYRLLLHIHTELFVDKWSTVTTITNYQQDSSVVTAANFDILKDSMSMLNKFSKSTAELVTSNSTSTKLYFTLGAGLTLDVDLWYGASLFVQPTIGWAFDYARPRSINNKNLTYNSPDQGTIGAHLTRFLLKQKLMGNLQAVIGIDVRGKFGFDPTYSAYIGANIGLNGVRKMLN